MTASSWTGTPATVTGSESSSTYNRQTYKLQLESGGADLLIDGVYFPSGFLHQKGGTPYTAHFNGIYYISVAGTDGCSGLHGCTGSYTLSVTEE